MRPIGSSNYINSLQNQYRYDYTSINPSYNNAPMNYGARTSYVNTDGVKYLQGIQNSAKSMSESLSVINQRSTFEKMAASSSSREHLTVDADSKPTAAFKETEIDIRQLAAAQYNKGTALKSGDLYAGAAGSMQFEIEIDGKQHPFSVDVETGDTNQAVQNKMLEAINRQDIGVHASLVLDSKNQTFSLAIEANESGADHSFVIRDVAGSLVAGTGASNIATEAQDAVYAVNGEEKVSSTNRVNLTGGVSVTLRTVTENSVVVSAEKDTQHAVDAFYDLISSYNDMLATAHTSTNGNTRLESNLTGAFSTYAYSLDKLGVSAGKDGYLVVDSKKLAGAAEDGSLEKFFAGAQNSSFGFVNRLSNITSNVQRSPGSYVAPPQSTESTSSSFEDWDFDIASLANSRSFNLKLYNQWYSLGYLFDLFV